LNDIIVKDKDLWVLREENVEEEEDDESEKKGKSNNSFLNI
jgi:hypothetical protein